MIDLKPYGAFIENTVRPLIQELKALKFRPNAKTIKQTLFHMIISKVIDSLTHIIGLCILGALCYAILRHSG